MLLIDTDPGLDDAHALAMATARVPHDELVVTTVAGNVGIDAVTRNAAWLLSRLAPTVPLHVGAAGPLVGAPVDAAHVHGPDGLGGFPREDAGIEPRGEHAVDAIVRLARQQNGELDVVALGPLTNIALAAALEPRLPSMIRSLTVMGGSPSGFGNASPNAEYNVFADPVAAEAVFARFPDATLVSWDLCLAVRFPRDRLDAFWAGGSDAARLLRALSDHRMIADPDYATSPDFGRADPLAMAVALDPRCVTRSTHHAVTVGHGGGLAHGLTVVDRRDEMPDRPTVRIVDELDLPMVTALLTV